MRYIELFAGIGGFRYGLERCMGIAQPDKAPRSIELGVQSGRQWAPVEMGSGIQPSHDCQFRSVYSNEWRVDDKGKKQYASSIYKYHYGEIDERDITSVRATEIPDHDLLTAGFPCQPFSVAGNRQGFEDTRGTLFFEIARILEAKRPRYLLLENVGGLFSHDFGKTFQRILRILSDLRYRVQWDLLNTKNYGLPHNRNRVFIIGHPRGEPRPEIFPLSRRNKSSDQKSGKQRLEPTVYPATRDNLIYSLDAGYEKNIAKRARSNIVEPSGVRRLTPTECERLQGFPDGWTSKGRREDGKIISISDSQRYKSLGNAVSTPVITAIGQRLLEAVQEINK